MSASEGGRLRSRSTYRPGCEDESDAFRVRVRADTGGVEMSGLECRNVVVDGRRTSVKLDSFTWRCLNEICDHRKVTVHDFCTEVKRAMADYTGFTSALRIAILRHYRNLASTSCHVIPVVSGAAVADLNGDDRLIESAALWP